MKEVTFYVLGPLLLGSLIVISFFAIIPAAQGVVWFAELTIRRVSEYPKGPLVALSALIAAVALLLKSIS